MIAYALSLSGTVDRSDRPRIAAIRRLPKWLTYPAGLASKGRLPQITRTVEA